jgi:hypothetical protein
MNWTLHHRKEKAKGGDNSKRNVVMVPQTKHVSWHILKGDMSLELFCYYVNNYYIDPDYEIWLVRKHQPVSPNQLELPM